MKCLRLLTRLGPPALLGVAVGCSHAVPRPQLEGAPAACGDARAVPLSDPSSTGSFARLRGTHRAQLTFACPSEQSCGLPADTQIELTLQPVREYACEFAACRVPYLGNLPFAQAPNDPCPSVLWSVFQASLKTNASTLDEQDGDVNVLASPRGEAYLRFMIETPSSLARAVQVAQPGTPLSTMLDVQLEVEGGRVRGQLSALAAPLPSEPATELRFKALWTATWESVPQT